MKEVLNRLQELIDTLSKGKISNFSRLIEIPDGTVRHWFIRGSTVSSEHIDKICKATGVSADWLLTGEGPMMRKDTTDDSLNHREAEDALGAVIYSRGAEKFSPEFIKIAKREIARLINEKDKK